MKKTFSSDCRALLEAIASRLAVGDDSIDDYATKTLLSYSIDHDDLACMVKSTIGELQGTGLIKKDHTLYEATLLGQAIVASALSPEDGLFVYRELRKALQAFVLDGEMHVLYSFTPVQTNHSAINWQAFRKEVESFDENNLRVLEFVGLKLQIINRM